MECRKLSVAKPCNLTMLDWIKVNRVGMFFKIRIVLDLMFPITAAPYSTLPFFLAAGPDGLGLGNLHGYVPGEPPWLQSQTAGCVSPY